MNMMLTELPHFDLPRLRREILGNGFRFPTPFGERLMVYADYTASGRGLRFVERYLMRLGESYANTHTEDDVTGRRTTRMLHRAEQTLKRCVHGTPDTCIVAVGAGATGAIQKLQEILGVYLPPATRDRLETSAATWAKRGGVDAEAFRAAFRRRRPVVFVGPYEHHSNEVSWRESLAEIHEVDLGENGVVDLDDLRRRVSDPAFEGRLKIGSFSAASNVTGIRSPVHEIARILHRHDALACFDYAAGAPYLEIDMNRDEETFFDAVFFSPHKFLGGPGSCGVLLFHRRIYRTDLPPTFCGGGTVDYVGPGDQDYARDIETREKAGTPGTLQVLRAMLALEVKEAVGVETIARRERAALDRVVERFLAHPGIEILGNPDPSLRVGILSLNIKDGDRYLHPKLATRLLNDLFGIQSRAGCSCAGPYGHRLLRIGQELSDRYRDEIRRGCQGIKPGWVRLCFHYVMDEADVDFICDAVEFLAEYGARFIPLYEFDLPSGGWRHRKSPAPETVEIGLAAALADDAALCDPPDDATRREEYRKALAAAHELAAALGSETPRREAPIPRIAGDLTYFNVAHIAPEAR